MMRGMVQVTSHVHSGGRFSRNDDSPQFAQPTCLRCSEATFLKVRTAGPPTACGDVYEGVQNVSDVFGFGGDAFTAPVILK